MTNKGDKREEYLSSVFQYAHSFTDTFQLVFIILQMITVLCATNKLVGLLL